MTREIYVYINYDIPEEDMKYLTPTDKVKDIFEAVLEDGNVLDEFVKDYKITIVDDN